MKVKTIKKQDKVNDLTHTSVQRSMWVPIDIWEAAQCLPGGRNKFIIHALTDAIASYSTELPKLKTDIEDINTQICRLESLKNIKLNRIKEIELMENNNEKEIAKFNANINDVVIETRRLLQEFRQALTKSHYKRLSELSGTPAKDIEQFIVSEKFRPTTEKIEEFYLR